MKDYKSIFRSYDIRGLYPDTIDADICYRIGRAFVVYLNAKKIIVGRDMRSHSPELEDAFVKGAIDQGADVIKIGLCSTPILNYASGKIECDGAAMITASHQPGQFNGIKLTRPKAISLSGDEGIPEVCNLAINKSYPESDVKGKVIEDESVKEDYYTFTTSFLEPIDMKMKIVIDSANGMGILEKKSFERLENIEVIALFDEFTGDFSNHEANPSKLETLADLQKKVVEVGADLGVAFDGDADRIAFVDEKGEPIEQSFVITLVAQSILKQKPGSLILYDLRLSNILSEKIKEWGGETQESRVGHAFIKKQMNENNAQFAAEISGHFYFVETYNAESSALFLTHLLNIMHAEQKPISEIIKPLQVYFHSGEINFTVEDKQKVLDQLKELYKYGNISYLDGIKIRFKDWWFNVRESKNDPVLRLNLEADTKELMEEKVKEISALIK